jgi:hypothetical protein
MSETFLPLDAATSARNWLSRASTLTAGESPSPLLQPFAVDPLQPEIAASIIDLGLCLVLQQFFAQRFVGLGLQLVD